jgi:predicted pyridoxine 5'-phosphate oxidase superfamily flavin-nucleotide-binding protein
MTPDASSGVREADAAHPITPEIARVVHEQGTPFVATVNADGTPNLSPKGSLTAAADGAPIGAAVETSTNAEAR